MSKPNPSKVIITEKAFSKQVEDLLNLFGWRWCHFRPARTEHGWRTALSGHQGFVDYVAIRSHRLLFVELKSEEGKVTEDQQQWHDGLSQCGQEVYIWRPSDFEDITKILEV